MFWEVAKCQLPNREAATDRVYAFHASRFFEHIEPIMGAGQRNAHPLPAL